MFSKYLFVLSVLLGAIAAENFTEHSVGKRDSFTTYAVYDFGDTITIPCSQSKTLIVKSFIYGIVKYRVDLGSCSAITLHIVDGLCKNKNSCTVEASNNVFGDPCPGTGKHLAVMARCQPSSPVGTWVLTSTIVGYADENSNLYLRCPYDHTIKEIQFASYGNPIRSWTGQTWVWGDFVASESRLNECLVQNALTGSCTIDTSTLPDIANGYTKNVLVSYTCL